MHKVQGLVLGAVLTFGGCDRVPTVPGAGSAATDVLYIESNNPTPGQNGILAYRREGDGSLTPLPGSPFPTGGTGVTNPTQKLGPDDLDQNLVASADHRHLFVTNGGSNTIAVFSVASDGVLTPVPGSPFPSGGVRPASIGLAGDRLYVVNQGADGAQSGATLPNYTGFTVGSGGQLTPIAGSTVTTVAQASPSQALISPGSDVLFGADFLAPMAPTPQPSLRAFGITSGGMLDAAPGTPMGIPGDPMKQGVLGLAVHPTQKLLYAGFVQQDRLGVYSYDSGTGALALQSVATNSGKALCWIVVSADGRWLYTSNTGDNSVSYYDLADPRAPVETQKLALKQPGPLFTTPKGMMLPTSEAFQLALDPAGTRLYVVSQHGNPDFSAPNGNVLHTLAVAPDGSLSEPGDVLNLPVPTTTRPQGVVVF